MFTHYEPTSRKLFDIENCENCGEVIQAPNGCKLAPAQRVPAGVRIWREALPAEGYWSDALGGEACENCNG